MTSSFARPSVRCKLTASSQLTGLCWLASRAHSPVRGDQRRVVGSRCKVGPASSTDPHSVLRAGLQGHLPEAQELSDWSANRHVRGIHLNDGRSLAVACVGDEHVRMATGIVQRVLKEAVLDRRVAQAEPKRERGPMPLAIEPALTPLLVIVNGFCRGVEEWQMRGVRWQHKGQTSTGLLTTGQHARESAATLHPSVPSQRSAGTLSRQVSVRIALPPISTTTVRGFAATTAWMSRSSEGRRVSELRSPPRTKRDGQVCESYENPTEGT